ncbi:NirD/YgiW/YdeI family stress tolerance protein [Endozoicomonas sp. 4G]|uniref:YgiW/YdeI family stress tolerance OB fold protein n=1 Tax=Endozoicomonas sp. 4G TaxID=2872754 RepID=UPI0020787187|nr:NirD/YgiW/YdeI family stress tolerance protein [Endozoicomonas sp. 4G]
MKKTLTAILAASTIALTAGNAFAEYTGPSSTPTINDVASIIENPTDDTRVELTGYLTNKIDNETYTFSDGKDSIQVEIDAKEMPKVAINEKTKVKIFGEVEGGAFETTEIEVERMSVM